MGDRSRGDSTHIDVLVFGEPSIDYVSKLDPAHVDNIDNITGLWNLNPNSYFAFLDEHEKTIIQLMVGKKWGVGGEQLPMKEKETLTKEDLGYLVKQPYDKLTWKQINDDSNSIISHGFQAQFGGPARNSLETIIDLSKNIKLVPEVNFKMFFLAGHEEATEKYREHLKSLNNHFPHGHIDVELLKHHDWATHEAYCFEGEDFRTLIRYQEKRQFFDPALIKSWFAGKNGHLTSKDVVYINSLKNRDLMAEVHTFLNKYEGKVILAPTKDMYKKSQAETNFMLKRADVIICNMDEACYIAGVEHSGDMPLEQKHLALSKLTEKTGKGRIYVSDEEKPPFAIDYNDEGIKIYSLSESFDVKKTSSINAGDTWSGVISSREIFNGNDIGETLHFATAYTSRWVSRPYSNHIVNKEDIEQFMEEQKDIKVIQPNIFLTVKNLY